MNEDFIHYIYKYKLFDKGSLVTQSGESVEIISTGVHNFDAGPDFFNAKVKIGETIWAGNVEIHLKSSDWFLHKHNNDMAYDNVVLQLVTLNDKQVLRSDETEIPTAVLSYDESLFDNYRDLMSKKKWISCEHRINEVDPFLQDRWFNKVLIERLEAKTTLILEKLEQNKNHWEETFYQMLLRNFGIKINAEPFEQISKSLPLNYLAKHKNNLLYLEAMLFGQAGLLEEEFEESYPLELQKHYKFFQTKFKLESQGKHLLKFMRLRPSGYPTIRLAQFANLIHKSERLFSKIIEAENFTDIEKLFDITASEYWDTHYVFGKEHKKRIKSLGKTTFENIVINTIIPFTFAYGQKHSDEKMKTKAIDWFEKIPPEKNSIIDKWKELIHEIPSAFYTQSLLHLKSNYCDKYRCLNCEIGSKLIQKKGIV